MVLPKLINAAAVGQRRPRGRRQSASGLAAIPVSCTAWDRSRPRCHRDQSNLCGAM